MSVKNTHYTAPTHTRTLTQRSAQLQHRDRITAVVGSVGVGVVVVVIASDV